MLLYCGYIFYVYNLIYYHNLTDIAFTEFKLGARLIQYETNERFLMSNHYTSEKQDKLTKLTQEELSKKRLEARHDLIRERQLDAKTELLSNLTWLFIGIIIFIFHWRLYNRASHE
jgi:hypothetical protein